MKSAERTLWHFQYPTLNWRTVENQYNRFPFECGKFRYNELKKGLIGISERMLIAKLKELENDGLVTRIVYPRVRPKVEYKLTALGTSLKDIINRMEQWGQSNIPLR